MGHTLRRGKSVGRDRMRNGTNSFHYESSRRFHKSQRFFTSTRGWYSSIAKTRGRSGRRGLTVHVGTQILIRYREEQTFTLLIIGTVLRGSTGFDLGECFAEQITGNVDCWFRFIIFDVFRTIFRVFRGRILQNIRSRTWRDKLNKHRLLPQ